MSIKDFAKKIKSFYFFTGRKFFLIMKSHLDIKYDLFVILTIIFTSLAGFGLGRLSALEKNRDDIEIKSAQIIRSNNGTTNFIEKDLSEKTNSGNNDLTNQNIIMSASAMIALENSSSLLVASKSGKKYHFPWCPGALKITEKNKITFNSYEEARKSGYSAASNCPGLE